MTWQEVRAPAGGFAPPTSSRRHPRSGDRRSRLHAGLLHTWAKATAWSRLQPFVTRFPDLTVEELRPIHAQELIDSFQASPSAKRNDARTMPSAAQRDCVDANPIGNFRKPKGATRPTVLSRKELDELLPLGRSDAFRELLTFAWKTRARAAALASCV